MDSKCILGVATVGMGIVILYTMSAKAEFQPEVEPESQIEPQPQSEGLIISTNTNVTGDCLVNECVIEKEITIRSTFKNIGYFNKSNIVGISVNNEILKQENITLQPREERTLIHNMILDSEIPYEICGLIIE